MARRPVPLHSQQMRANHMRPLPSPTTGRRSVSSSSCSPSGPCSSSSPDSSSSPSSSYAPLPAASSSSTPRPFGPRQQQAPTPLRSTSMPMRAASAAAGAGGADDSSADGDAVQSATSFLAAFWKFLRPHTIRGTILGTTAVVTRALLDNPNAIDWGLLPRALLGLLALLCGNGYIVGINQIYDVEIDALNKPFLPVAAGELSKGAAWLLVAGLAAAGLAITSTNFGPLISRLYAFGLFLGTIYSIPPFRLKRFAIPAFMIIACVRGFLLNFGVYHAARAALQLPFSWSPPITFITVFVTVFATVIAITKDLPDVEGDQAHNIQTFATRLGVPTVSNLGIGLLFMNYAGAVTLGLKYAADFNTPLMVGAHAVLAAVLVLRALKLAKAGYTRDAVNAFYRWIWNLFYAEYALLPFI